MTTCPCASGLDYAECCGPLHDGALQAPTALALMRSRYAAYALGRSDYVFRTWHPRSRPADVDARGPRWTGLEIVEVVDGEVGDQTGVVEFVASHEGGKLRERSRFARRAGRWFYLDAI